MNLSSRPARGAGQSILIIGLFLLAAGVALIAGQATSAAPGGPAAPPPPAKPGVPTTPTPTPTCAVPSAHRILLVGVCGGAPGDSASCQPLTAQIAAQPGVAAADFFNAGTTTPTLAQLQAYDTLVVFNEALSGVGWANATALGNVLAAYVDAGGAVVEAQWNWENFGAGGPPTGAWASGGYSPFNIGSIFFGPRALGTYTPGHPLMAGVSTLNNTTLGGGGLAAGATQVAAVASLGLPYIAVKGRVVGLNAYLGADTGDYPWSGDWARVIANAAEWLNPTVCATDTPTPTNTPTNTSTPTNTPTNTNTATTTLPT